MGRKTDETGGGFSAADHEIEDDDFIETDDDDIEIDDVDIADEIAGSPADDKTQKVQGDDLPEEEREDADEIVDEELEPETDTVAEETPETSGEMDSDLHKLPSKIANRIMRERRIARRAVAESEQARAETARYRGENESHRRNAVELQRGTLKMLSTNAEERVKQLKADLQRAIEEGDTNKQVDLQDDLSKARAAQMQIDDNLRRLPTEEQVQADTRRTEVNQPSAPQPANELASRWVGQQKWWNDPKYLSVKSFTLAEDKQLVAEGYDPKSPEFFVQLTQRIAKRFPEVRPVTHEGKRVATGQQQRGGRGKQSPVSVTRAAVGSGRRVATVQLRPEDKANMRRFGLDPSNKEHRSEYARQIAVSERSK